MTKEEIDQLIESNAVRKCCSCNELLHVKEFYIKKDTKKDKHYRFNSPCKICSNVNRNIDYQKAYQRKRKYNLTSEQYNDKLKIQNYSCDICNVHIDNLNKELAVDHCHTTGKIRGLLCGNCNSGIGFFNDDISRIKNAIQYLKKHL
jgi:hypothetical protein